jgi:hypothetical protein
MNSRGALTIAFGHQDRDAWLTGKAGLELLRPAPCSSSSARQHRTIRRVVPEGPAALPVTERKGLATAALFDLGDKKVTNPDDVAKVKQTADLINDPARSHFFNTDCVSCHTATRRTIDLLQNTNIPGVNLAVLPKEKWNVRNFGWFPAFLRSRGATQIVEATATRRTAAETAAVVEFINKNGLAK